MAKVYNFNGLADGASDGTFIAGGDSPDVVNLTYGEGFFTTNIRNEGTNVVIETEIGGTSATFLMQGVILDQLRTQNFSMNGDGVVRMGNNNDNTLAGNILVGKGGNDTLNGTPDNDFLAGNAGEDYIYGGGGMDRIRGGQNDDHIYDFGSGSIVYGDKGDDTIEAQNDLDADEDGVTIFGGSGDPNDPLDGIDRIQGSNRDDMIQGNGGDDVINGRGDEDEIRGGKDDDFLRGGGGDDWVRGDKGDDTVQGDAGDDTIEGGDGDDSLYGGKGGDEMSGGEGDDTFFFDWLIDDQSEANPNLSLESVSADILNTPAQFLGTGQLDQIDSITDLDLGGKNNSNDLLGFEWWDGGNVDTVNNVSASTVQDLLDLFNEVSVGGDDVILINVNGGGFEGKSFILADTLQGGPAFSGPEFLLQVTGYTGTLGSSDIIGYEAPEEPPAMV